MSYGNDSAAGLRVRAGLDPASSTAPTASCSAPAQRSGSRRWALAVAATVALVDLGKRTRRNRRAIPDTPWLLYTVIAISAAVIIGAVPLLIAGPP